MFTFSIFIIIVLNVKPTLVFANAHNRGTWPTIRDGAGREFSGPGGPPYFRCWPGPLRAKASSKSGPPGQCILWIIFKFLELILNIFFVCMMFATYLLQISAKNRDYLIETRNWFKNFVAFQAAGQGGLTKIRPGRATGQKNLWPAGRVGPGHGPPHPYYLDMPIFGQNISSVY